MRRIHTWALVAVIVATFAGCSSTPLAPTSTATPVATAAPQTPPPSTAASSAAAPTGSVLPEYLDPNSPLARQRSVYFDYDDFSIKPEYVSMLERHGRYLTGRPALAIRIEGNADERGSAEYNLALGQKRAQAVLKALELYGVKDSQMEAVSWGKERPKATGHDEAAWAENRRADLVYPQR